MLHPLKPKRTNRRAHHHWGRKLYLCDRILQVAPRVKQLTQDSYGYQYGSDVGYYNFAWGTKQASLRTAGFLDKLMDFSFEIARSNPTVTTGLNSSAEWVDTLWEGKTVWTNKEKESVAIGMSDWMDGFRLKATQPVTNDINTLWSDWWVKIRDNRALSEKAFDYAGRLRQAARAIDDVNLKPEVKKADFLSHLVNLGGAYATLNESEFNRFSYSNTFLTTLRQITPGQSLQQGTDQLKDFLRSTDAKRLLQQSKVVVNLFKFEVIESGLQNLTFLNQMLESTQKISAGATFGILDSQPKYSNTIWSISELDQSFHASGTKQQCDFFRALIPQLEKKSPDIARYINPDKSGLYADDGTLVASAGSDNLLSSMPSNTALRQEPNYDAVVVKRDIKIKFFDYAADDGDVIDILINGRVVTQNLRLISNSWINRNPLRLFDKPYEVTLNKDWMQPGENVLEIRGANNGLASVATVGVDFDPGATIYGSYRHTAAIAAGSSRKITFGLPKIRVNGDRYPFSADHIIDTLRQPRILTIDRNGADSRREDNLRRYKELGGITQLKDFDQDEAPPAVFAESINAHVRLIPYSDNRGSGSQIKSAINYYGIKNLELQNGWNVDFYATEPTVPTPLRVPDVSIDWNYQVI
jgi:hypothetical protein